MNSIFTHPSDGEGSAELQELLQMGARVLVGFPTEWASLHHGNETRLDLEAYVSHVHLRAFQHLRG